MPDTDGGGGIAKDASGAKTDAVETAGIGCSIKPKPQEQQMATWGAGPTRGRRHTMGRR